MKVVQEPTVPAFHPITIILESKEEADAMYARLNLSPSHVSGYGVSDAVLERLNMSMYSAYIAVYHS